MTKHELIKFMADAAGISNGAASCALEAQILAITVTLRKGDRVTIPGLGTFEGRMSKTRVGRNPRTGEAVLIPGRRISHFKPAAHLKATITD